MMRLSDRQKKFICVRIARFAKRADIIKDCIKEFMLDDAAPVREQLYRKIDYFQGHPNAGRWQRFITQTRADWLDDVRAVPLANPRIRIMELVRFYDRCSDRLSRCEGDAESDRLASAALKILKQIREEVEAMIAECDLEGASGTGFEDLSDEELLAAAAAAGIRVPKQFAGSLSRRGTG